MRSYEVVKDQEHSNYWAVRMIDDKLPNLPSHVKFFPYEDQANDLAFHLNMAYAAGRQDMGDDIRYGMITKLRSDDWTFDDIMRREG